MQAIKKVVKFWPVVFARLAGYYFLLVVCPVMGQALQKKVLTEADYTLWGSLVNQHMTENGEWVSYSMNYERTDTLFVKNATNGKTFSYPKHYDGEFGGDTWFASKRNDTLSLRNLDTGKMVYRPNISHFTFSEHGKYLLLFYRETETTEQLIIKDGLGQIVGTAAGVCRWKWNDDKNTLAYTTISSNVNSSEILFLKGKVAKRKIIDAVSGVFKNITWQNEFLAFVQETSGKGVLYLYNSKSGRMNTFIPEHCGQFPNDMWISSDGLVTISSDGSRVVFALKEPKLSAAPEEIVEVWNANDVQLHSGVKKYGDLRLYDKAAVWFPASDRFLQLTNRKEYAATIGPKGDYAISYDPMAHEPQFDSEAPRDIYVTNLKTGEKELVVEKVSGQYGTLQLSPEGKYICYVKDNNWWVYNIKGRTHMNVTENLGVPVHQTDYDRAGELPMCGIAGWSANDKSLFIYDEYDIWQVTPDGSQNKCLTNGREIHTKFRFENTKRVQNVLTDSMTAVGVTIDSTQEQVLKAQNIESGFSGYYSMNNKNGLCQLVWQYEKTEQLVKTNTAGCFSYVAERYDSPPSVMHYRNNKTTEVYQSNCHQYNYKWGYTERITYRVNGKLLSGVLFIPADYERSKLYPMIVSIYERQSSMRHQFVNPTLFNEGGINIANLSAKGYFVLLPDIAYAMGDVGNSVVDCLSAAIDVVLMKYSVDPKRLGLTGHSFGGYETFLAITKTDRFAAAFAGSASSDLISTYLQVGGNNKPNIFRFEHQQYRMGKSLFDDEDRYLKNSPVLLAKNVHTPILAWAGEIDNNVNPLQSKEFYIAMRRLGKEHTLLVYPGEGHSLVDKEKQADLTHRFEAWFAKYLKP